MAAPELWRFREERDPGDADLRFHVVEDRGDRVLVRELACDAELSIAPTFVYLKADLVRVEA